MLHKSTSTDAKNSTFVGVNTIFTSTEVEVGHFRTLVKITASNTA